MPRKSPGLYPNLLHSAASTCAVILLLPCNIDHTSCGDQRIRRASSACDIPRSCRIIFRALAERFGSWRLRHDVVYSQKFIMALEVFRMPLKSFLDGLRFAVTQTPSSAPAHVLKERLEPFISDLQHIAKAEEAKLSDVDGHRNGSSEFVDQMKRLPSLEDIGATREGLSASGREGIERARRFSELSPQEATSELYEQLGDLVKCVADATILLNKKDALKSTTTQQIIDEFKAQAKNLLHMLTKKAEADGSFEDDEDETEQEEDVEKSAVKAALKAIGLKSPTDQDLNEAISRLKNGKIGAPPDFSVTKSAKDINRRIAEAKSIAGRLTAARDGRLKFEDVQAQILGLPSHIQELFQ